MRAYFHCLSFTEKLCLRFFSILVFIACSLHVSSSVLLYLLYVFYSCWVLFAPAGTHTGHPFYCKKQQSPSFLTLPSFWWSVTSCTFFPLIKTPMFFNYIIKEDLFNLFHDSLRLYVLLSNSSLLLLMKTMLLGIALAEKSRKEFHWLSSLI